MYIPSYFQETDLAKLHDFMEHHAFATLISHGERDPVASHLPLLLDRTAGAQGKLIGHMARENSHWRAATGQQALVIFHGSHAYISPGWVDVQNMVPTWNYVAVHAYGPFRLIEERDRLREIVRQLVERYEASQPRPWSMGVPESNYIEKLLGAIVGFEIDIERLDGKWKLNQNHPPERRKQIAQALRETGRQEEINIAKLMEGGRDG